MGKRTKQLMATIVVSQRFASGIDKHTAARYAVIPDGRWNAGTPIPTNDLWIAASAMEYGLAVITMDAHFLKIPYILVRHSEPAKSDEAQASRPGN